MHKINMQIYLLNNHHGYQTFFRFMEIILYICIFLSFFLIFTFILQSTLSVIFFVNNIFCNFIRYNIQSYY